MNMVGITVLEAHASSQTAAPAVVFGLRLENLTGTRIHALGLRCQIRIEPRGRRYTGEEQARLFELLGDVEQRDRALRSAAWAQSSTVVPSFDRHLDIELTVACTHDLEIASAKYLQAVRAGDVPLAFAFSGTAFLLINRGSLNVEPVPWNLRVSFRMPVSVWQAAMDRLLPGDGWLRLQRETIDRLQAFRGAHAVVSWDEAIGLLLNQETAK
jgi:Family of unknown function (DUF6084)